MTGPRVNTLKKTKNFTYVLLISLAVSLAVLATEPTSKKVIETAGIRVDPKTKTLELKGKICTAGDLVEFFAVTTYGHTYESVIAVSCRPSQLHTALIAIGGIDRSSLQDKGEQQSADKTKKEDKEKSEEGVTRFSCEVAWDLPDRFAVVEPYEALENLKPEKLYALTIDDPGTEDEWLMLSPWKIHWNPKKREGQILLDVEMPELLDPEDPEFYWRNHVRRTTVSEDDKIIYYYDQPNKKVKGQFKPFGRLKRIREEPRHYQVPAGDLVVSLESGNPLGDVQWVFSGSLIDTEVNEETQKKEPFYVADRTGVVMQLMRDRLAVLDSQITLPKLENQIGTAFGVNEKVCPPVGTEVVLTFKPLPMDKSSQKEDNISEN